MNSFKQYRSACIGVAVFVGMLGLLVPYTSYGKPDKGAKDVNVVNQPTVTVDDTTPIKVDVQGGAIAAVVTVDNVGTNPLPVLDVDNPARQRFADTVVASLAFDSYTSSSITTVTVPANKILVIEHVSLISQIFFRASQGTPQLTFHLNVETNGISFSHSLGRANQFLTPELADDGHFFSLSQPVRLYADPNSTVELQAFRNFQNRVNSNSQTVSVVLSGHFVDP